MAELLSVPLKKSTDVDIVKPLRNLLQATYADGADHSEALAELARLRTNAIWKVFEKSSLDDIYSYYDQLVALESKIPPQEVQVPFKWKDAFDRGSFFGGRMSLTVSSLAFERVCVLFNIGALQSAAAAGEGLAGEEPLRRAARLLQQAAGVFQALRPLVLPALHAEPTPDLAPDTLAALAALMLAQAQELIAYKCIRDEMKDSMVAKVCAQAEELYGDALRAMQKETVRPLWDKEWLPTVSAKQAAARGLAQLHQAGVARAAGAPGEAVARLKLAAEQLRAAATRLPAHQMLREQAARADRLLAETSRDNDFIYHERVPEPAQLEPVARAAVAQALPPPERWIPGGRELFAGLVPLSVQQALQSHAARRAELVGAEIDGLREATQLLNGALASLGLPACLEGAADGALPASLGERAEALRAAGGVEALRRLMAELPELLQRNREILDEAERMLREEAEADAALRSQFGPRWSRTESAKLTEAFRANATKYSQIIDNAVRADNIVQQKFQQHKESMELLVSGAAPDADAGASGASAPRGAAADELRDIMREVDELKAERDSIEAELKAATTDMRAQFLAALAADGAVDEPALSATALGTALAPLRARAAQARQRQEALLARARDQHARLPPAGPRDRALAGLAAAADAYSELTANLKEGVKFYNDLTQLLLAFQNKVSDFCFARKTEKEELLKDLTQEASRPPPSAGGPEVGQQRAAPQPPGAPGAPLPYPAAPQGMPLPYGAPMASYPMYAPLPAGYNPYATLPYPSQPRAAPYMPYQHPGHPGHPSHPPPYGGYPQQPPH